MVVGHFYSIQESLEAVVTAMKHHLYTCEMMDDTILNCTKTNREQAKIDFFIQGDPGCGYDVEKQLIADLKTIILYVLKFMDKILIK
jgi:hypothetical protein